MKLKSGAKIKTIILCVVLLVNGLFFIIPSISEKNSDIIPMGARAPEGPGLNGTNDHPPTIIKNSPLSPNNNFSNEPGTPITFNITIMDDDEPPNGSHIANATVHVGILGAIPAYADMEFWNFTGLNVSRKIGRWVYNFTIPAGVQPGQYFVGVNASDAGNISDGNKNKSYSIDSFEIIIHQQNRAPEQNGSTIREVMCDEDTAMAYFELDDIFADLDVDTPPPYTDPDSLVFQMWNGSAWVGTYDFGNYTITVIPSTGNLTFVPDANWFNAQDASTPPSVPAEDSIMFRANDSHQANVTHNLTFRVISVNDPPTLNHTNDWLLNVNVTLDAGDEFNGDEDALWSIQVVANDVDTFNPNPDTLIFSVQNSAEIPAMMAISSTGLFEFTPTNDEVGMHVVNVTVTDGIITDHKFVTFDVKNTNDAPTINDTKDWMINENVTLASDDKFIGNEDSLWTIQVIAEDIDTLHPNPDILTFSVENSSEIPAKMDISSTGIFNFTPTNDEVGTYMLNISVTDGTATANKEISLQVNNTNNPPKFTNVWVGTNSIKITKHAVTLSGTNSATEDEEFMFTVEAVDEDVGETLTFTREGYSYFIVKAPTGWGSTKWNFSFTPDDDDAKDGFVEVNISVKDSSGNIGDWVEIHINVNNVNDPPVINKVGYKTSFTDKTVDRYWITPGDYDNFTIYASDSDDDTLTCKSDNTDATITDGGKNYYGETMWDISFSPSTSDDAIINFTVSDGKLSDYVRVTWDVLAPPTITVSTEDNKKYTLGQTIIIEGTWADKEDLELDWMDVKIKFPDGKETKVPEYEYYRLTKTKFEGDDLWHYEMGYGDDYLWEYLEVNEDGTWKYTFNTDQYNKAYDYLSSEDPEWMENSMPTKLTKGEIIFTFKAGDEDSLESEEQSIKVILEGDGGNGPPPNGNGPDTPDKKDDDDDEGGGFEAAVCGLVAVIVIIVIIVVIVMVLKKRKKPEERAPERAPYAPPPPPPPAEAPSEEAPEEIPPETPPEEPPVEVPQEEVSEELPPETPPEEPPTEAPLEEAPWEMPPEQPPAEVPPEEIPSEFPPEMPSEQPPAEVPPEEIPPEELPEEPPAEIPPEEIPPEMPLETPPEEPPVEVPPEEVPEEMPPEMPQEQPPVEAPPEDVAPMETKDLMFQGSNAYSEGRYTDAIIAWQQVLEREPGQHPDIEMAIKDAMEKMKG